MKLRERLTAVLLCALAWGVSTARAQTGACCVTSPAGVTCQQVTESECAALGGVWRGAGTSCNSAGL